MEEPIMPIMLGPPAAAGAPTALPGPPAFAGGGAPRAGAGGGARAAGAGRAPEAMPASVANQFGTTVIGNDAAYLCHPRALLEEESENCGSSDGGEPVPGPTVLCSAAACEPLDSCSLRQCVSCAPWMQQQIVAGPSRVHAAAPMPSRDRYNTTPPNCNMS